ncbi:hypothetical protein K7X08_033861 [Anisodus acutangulus]|uniref:Uncharacterized protein n=1 Tax=Anisodus acutangulus TaxID=402998 RepID=A0A9Q1RCF3_9SOLA|nr:hypothetical protein K7X08_033861 [Anisodus acutangulus]
MPFPCVACVKKTFLELLHPNLTPILLLGFWRVLKNPLLEYSQPLPILYIFLLILSICLLDIACSFTNMHIPWCFVHLKFHSFIFLGFILIVLLRIFKDI